MSGASYENRGHCALCCATLCWLGAPKQSDALCPTHAIPLERTQRYRARDARVNRRPLTKPRPALVLKEIA